MQTLDEAWTAFRNVAQATAHLIRTNPGYDPKYSRALTTVAVVAAALRHASTGAPEGESGVPSDVMTALTVVRSSFGRQSDPAALLDSANKTFAWLRAESARGKLRSPLLDAVSAVGWVCKAQLCVLGGELALAQEAGRNTLDAVSRVLVLTGHSADALRQFLVEEHRRSESPSM